MNVTHKEFSQGNRRNSDLCTSNNLSPAMQTGPDLQLSSDEICSGLSRPSVARTILFTESWHRAQAHVTSCRTSNHSSFGDWFPQLLVFSNEFWNSRLSCNVRCLCLSCFKCFYTVVSISGHFWICSWRLYLLNAADAYIFMWFSEFWFYFHFYVQLMSSFSGDAAYSRIIFWRLPHFCSWFTVGLNELPFQWISNSFWRHFGFSINHICRFL